MPDLKHIEVHLIDPPELAMRGEISDEGMADLVASMSAIGLQQPINVRVKDDRFQVISGHRRYLAAKQLGWRTIMALVWQSDDEAYFAQMLHENSVREDVNAAEEALWYAQLVEKFALDEASLVLKVRKSADYIGARWKLLNGDPEVFNALLHRQINFSVASALNRCKSDDSRRVFLDLAMRGGHGAATVLKWVVEDNSRVLPQSPAPPAAPPVELQQQVPAPRVECWMCGGEKAPGNLVMIYVHTWCKEHAEKLMRQPAQEESA